MSSYKMSSYKKTETDIDFQEWLNQLQGNAK